jgi:putative ABC transport system ATP-binding protein
MNSPLLEARTITKSYGRGSSRFTALDGVSLTVSAGEAVAIVGKSGSGKSTLMHLLALLDAPDSGSVRVSGSDPATMSTAQMGRIRNRDFGFVFQQFFLTPHATVLENVMLPLKIAGVGARERKLRAIAVLEQLELADKATNKAVNLSGGQKQRVVIARALVNRPKVIFADEPTGNLDSTTSQEILGLLRRAVDEFGQAVVMVTHDAVAASVSDRVVFLDDGNIVADEPHLGAEQILDQMKALA